MQQHSTQDPLQVHDGLIKLPSCLCPSTEWRPGSTGQILSDLDLTSQKEGRWKRLNTLAHYNVSLDPCLCIRDINVDI